MRWSLNLYISLYSRICLDIYLDLLPFGSGATVFKLAVKAVKFYDVRVLFLVLAACWWNRSDVTRENCPLWWRLRKRLQSSQSSDPSESFLPCFTRQNWQFERRENDSGWKAFARVCVSFQVVCALIPDDGFDMVWPCLMHQMHMKKTEQSSNNCRPGKAKRRIIGGVVRAPSEAIPVATLECGRERCICLKRSREENYKTNKGCVQMTRVFEFWLHCGETFHVQDGSYAACGSISRVQACLVYGWVLKTQFDAWFDRSQQLFETCTTKGWPCFQWFASKGLHLAAFEHFCTQLFLFYVLNRFVSGEKCRD